MADGCYNHIYSVLVESDQDTLGIIAYALYKRQKIEFRNQASQLVQGFLDASIATQASELDRYYSDKASIEIRNAKPGFSRVLYLESEPGAETGDRAGLRCGHH
ncbi:hypothetical protein [Pseudomonas sp.]|uniref:hypothetical protein n=1 Tax=Pseudomonas sp. TaxID=306 RepID=UPI0025EC35A8|nr:hypothetical protein [Pseudomonas sp.]